MFPIWRRFRVQWYPGDGRVLPMEEALKLVCLFVGQEMQLRAALVAGEAGWSSSTLGVAPASSGGVTIHGHTINYPRLSPDCP